MTTAPTLININPAELIVDLNVRKDANLTPEFLKSIKRHGVLMPIVVYQDVDGAYNVLMGQRRTLAAVEGGLSTIPAMVGGSREEADRIVGQLVENEHRAAIHIEEEVSAYQQLSLLGMPAIDIAKSTGAKIARVGDALKAAKSTAAMNAIATYQATIDDALIYAEFDGDTGALEQLDNMMTQNPGRLAHQAQMIRDERIREAARQVVADEILAKGLLLADPEAIAEDPSIMPVDELYTNPAKYIRLTEGLALLDAGEDLRAYPYLKYNGWDLETGRQIPATWEIAYAVANYEAHGWSPRLPDVTGAGKGPLSDEDKAQRALQKINGKSWVAATTLRHDWITKLLERRNLPNEWPALAALCFATLPSDYGSRTNELAHKLLAVEKPGSYSATALPAEVTTNPLRAPHVMVAIAAAWMESNLAEKKGWDSRRDYLPLYLSQLAAWGYPLSELEQNIVDKTPADDTDS